MVRPFGKFVLALAAVVLVASPAWAQAEKKGRGFGGGGMGGGGMILRAENVQKDLKLSDEQIGKIQSTLSSIQEKHRDDYAGFRDLPREEQIAKMASLNKEVNEEIKKDLSFTPEQSKRFDQISLQARGVQAFLDPSVQEKLKLTADQKSQIREIAQSGGGGRGGFNKNASAEEKAEAFKKAQTAREENQKKVMALLSDDQKKEWKELTGEPIELRFGGQGGGGNRRRNNNN